jgi:hypothetical protein
MADAPDASDPWASTESIITNIIGSDDPWGDTTDSAPNAATNSKYPYVNVSVSTAPAPDRIPEQDFTGFNSERLTMLDGSEEGEDESARVEEPTLTYASRGRGENAVELPFNRLDMMNNAKEASGRKVTENDESEISEEE